MSSLVLKPNGRYRLQIDFNGKRRAIPIGKVPSKLALAMQVKLDELAECRRLNIPPDRPMKQWLEGVDAKLHNRLVEIGLVSSSCRMSLEELADAYLEKMAANNARPRTLQIVLNCKRNLTTYFAGDTDIRTLNHETINYFRKWMATEGKVGGLPLAKATLSRRLRRMRSMFKFACDDSRLGGLGAIEFNPFGHLKMSKSDEVNTDKDAYITRDEYDAMVSHSNERFGLLLAFIRYGGLRSPSEVVPLTFSDIDQGRGVAIIRGVKTATRQIPLGPEIVEQLDRQERLTTPEALLFPNWQSKHSGSLIRNMLGAVCNRADLRVWSKPFVNLRASCESDWFRAGYGVDVVMGWMGHSAETALTHYNRATQRLATEEASTKPPIVGRNCTPSLSVKSRVCKKAVS